MELQLKKGDISLMEADAIVNAANTDLWMGSGVAGALKEFGGKEIEQEAISKGPIGLGEAIETSAGKLKAKYVIHAAAMHALEKASPESIRLASLNALKKADELGCKSIAFPALGCGIGGQPIELGTKTMISEIKKFRGKNLKKAVLVLYSPTDFETCQAELKTADKEEKKKWF